MIAYIESGSTDPRRNLALEQFVFDSLDQSQSYCMLWQNEPSVIVGKNQNTLAEINESFIKAHNISVVRRLSGGGAVYHDLGNLNYTFISGGRDGEIDFASFCRPIREALVSFGVPAEISGRNDMVADGKKFSGNAMYFKRGRIMHHGTILYDSDLDVLSNALNVPDDKLESKGIKSVRSRVTNIRPYMKTDMTLRAFWDALKSYLFAALEMKEYFLSADEEAGVEKLKESVYSRRSWNYGGQPQYTVRKTRRVEGCGTIEALLDVGKDGVIKDARFYGDFFGNEDSAGLGLALAGRRFEYGEAADALQDVDVSRFINKLDSKTLLSLLFE